LSPTFVLLHRTVTSQHLTATQTTFAFSTVFGATHNYDTIVAYTLVEEDGELKILHCKDFANPQQRNALFVGTVTKAAAERERIAAQ
jgi:hypothetical protein